jgi:hypothetical protein
MSVSAMEVLSSERIVRRAGLLEAVRADRAAAVDEPHQQPATTQARWIGRPGTTPAPIAIR